jgi:hypothetical protein
VLDHRRPGVRDRVRAVPQLGPAAVQAREGFLHHVFRGSPVSDEQHREAEQAQPVFGKDVPDIPGLKSPGIWRVGHTRLVPIHAY